MALSTPIVTISPEARAYAAAQGLEFTTVSWEDCARAKWSTWGPCVSDMTLKANGQLLPILREPNYTDRTWDAPMSDIKLVINGRHCGFLLDDRMGDNVPYAVSLDTYLQLVATPSSSSAAYRGCERRNLFAPHRDSHVVVSTQACFLPLPTVPGAEVEFNLALRYHDHTIGSSIGGECIPLLILLCTSHGTTSHLVFSDQEAQDLLALTSANMMAYFVGERLSKNRAERGILSTGPMTAEEKHDNFIMVIQVPLKYKRTVVNSNLGEGGGGAAGAGYRWPFIFPSSSNLAAAPPAGASQVSFDVVSAASAGPSSPSCFGPSRACTAAPPGGAGAPLAKTFSFGAASPPTVSFGAPWPSPGPAVSFGVASPPAVSFGAASPPAVSFGAAWPSPGPAVSFGAASPPAVPTPPLHCDVEDAIVKVGPGLPWTYPPRFRYLTNDSRLWKSIERDDRYPVRVTIQYYKATSNGLVTEQVIQGIAAQFAAARMDARAKVFGSLVTNSTFFPRPTEPLPSALPSPFGTLGGRTQTAAEVDVDLHPNIFCDQCKKFIRLGVRYKCTVCPDFDLCGTCELISNHTRLLGGSHLFIKIPDSRSCTKNIATLNKSGLSHHLPHGCSGCKHTTVKGLLYACQTCSLIFCEACDATVGHQVETGHTMLRVTMSGSRSR